MNFFFGASCYRESNIKTSSPNVVISLKDWLERTEVGRGILTQYSVRKSLSAQFQCHLCDLILAREVDGLGDYPKITPENFSQLAREINKLFSNESTGTYYVPSVKKTQYSPSVPAQGKLIQQYSYLKKKKEKISSTI